MVRTCLPIIRSNKDHLARHSEGNKTKGKTKEAVGRKHQKVDKTGLSRIPGGYGRRTEMDASGCETIGCSPSYYPPGQGTDINREDSRSRRKETAVFH